MSNTRDRLRRKAAFILYKHEVLGEISPSKVCAATGKFLGECIRIEFEKVIRKQGEKCYD